MTEKEKMIVAIISFVGVIVTIAACVLLQELRVKSDLKYLDSYCAKFHYGTKPEIQQGALYFCVKVSESSIERVNVTQVDYETWKRMQKELEN